jgi:hypothetical protein
MQSFRMISSAAGSGDQRMGHLPNMTAGESQTALRTPPSISKPQWPRHPAGFLSQAPKEMVTLSGLNPGLSESWAELRNSGVADQSESLLGKLGHPSAVSRALGSAPITCRQQPGIELRQ